jgi:hypothetical protein
MKFILTAALSLSIYFSFAQDHIDSAISVLTEKYPQEKIYIAYDQSSYLAGETIWFKSFIYSDHLQTDISTNLWVELMDQNKTVIQRKFIPIINGIAESQIALSDTLPENNYFIRAYTNWMLNFEEQSQYIQPVLIYHPGATLKLKHKKPEIDAAAFVESGNFIANESTQIAFRMYSNEALPEHWKGYIIDSLQPNIKVNSFESINKNVAVINFVPKENIQYQAIIETTSEKIKSISLPLAKPNGVSLHVSQSDNVLTYSGMFSNIPKGTSYKLKGTINNTLVYKAIIKNNDGIFKRSFSTEALPKGIFRLSLFDVDDQMVAERLCFLYPKLETDILIDSTIIDTHARGLNRFQSSADSGRSYFISVFDENNSSTFSKNNFISSIWLTNDFSKNVEDASSLFSGNKQQNETIIDALMITETSKSFDWKQILQHQYPTIHHYKDNYLSYKAKATYKKKDLKNESLTIFVQYPDSTKQVLQAQTNVDGEFLIDGLIFEDLANISFQPNNKKLNKNEIRINYQAIQQGTAYKGILPSSNYYLIDANTTERPTEEITKRLDILKNEKAAKEKYHTLEEVVVISKARNTTAELDRKYSTGRISGARETIIDFINKEQSSTNLNVFDWLVTKGIVNLSSLKDGIYKFYLNEFPCERFDLEMLSADNVALIKDEGRLQFHSILVYQKKGGDFKKDTSTYHYTKIPGYSKSETFISPNYADNIALQTWEKDNRNVLYWGNLISSESTKNKEHLKFYNNDSAKKYRVVIMGFTEEGFPFWKEIILQ